MTQLIMIILSVTVAQGVFPMAQTFEPIWPMLQNLIKTSAVSYKQVQYLNYNTYQKHGTGY